MHEFCQKVGQKLEVNPGGHLYLLEGVMLPASWLQRCAPQPVTSLGANWVAYLPHAGKQHGDTVHTSTWGSPAAGMLGCLCSPLGKGVHMSHSKLSLVRISKFKPHELQHGNPGMTLKTSSSRWVEL